RSSISTTTLPLGLTLTDNHDGTATISGTPVTGSGGKRTVTVTADNGQGSVVTQNLTLTVTQPPAILSAGSTTFTAGQAGTFTVTTSGSVNTQLARSGALPTGLTFVTNADGTATLAGTTTVRGTFTITITATDGLAPDAVQLFTITVS